MEIPIAKSVRRNFTSPAPGRSRIFGAAMLAALLAISGAHGQQSITGNYSQNFNSIGTGLSSGWSVYTGAIATGLGTVASLNTTPTQWSDSGGAFKNFASNNIDSGSSSTVQAADTDRALGIRQTGSFGDPGASFDFNFSTINATVSSLSLDLMTLSDQGRTTVWTLQYGIGVSPTSFTTLGTYTSGPFTTTTATYTSALFGTNLDNQANVWFRVVALSGTSGANSRDSSGIDNFSLLASYTPPPPDVWTGDGSGATWANGATGHFASNYTNSLANSASFVGLGETVTTSGTVQAGGISFSTSDSSVYTVTGSGVTVGTFGITTTTDAIISAPIAGTSGLTKEGAANLTLGATNTFTGNVKINAGKLIISADANLGAASNGIVLNGGTLKPATTLTLASTHTLSGTGTLEIAGGNTLTLNGPVNANTVTLSDAGNLILNGTTNILGGLVFNKATTLSDTGGILALNGITTTNTTGTVTISGTGLNLGTASRLVTVADGSAGTDLLITSNISSSSTVKLQKRGAGTLELTGDNSASGGIQLGAQGDIPQDGGRILFATANAIGAGQIQANYGTLEATAPITRSVGVSIGGRGTGFPTFTGSDMTLNGATGAANSFFLATGTVDGDIRFNVNNTTTLGGVFAATTGTGGIATGIAVGGTGTLVIAGDATLVAEPWKTTDTLTFQLGSAGKIGVGGIDIASGTKLVIDITSAIDFGSGTTGPLMVENGGLLVFNLNTSAHGDWVFFASGAGIYTNVSIGGSAYGSLNLIDNGDGTWSGSSGATDFNYDVATTTLSVVPEPQTYALIGLGLMLILAKVRRKNSGNLARQA